MNAIPFTPELYRKLRKQFRAIYDIPILAIDEEFRKWLKIEYGADDQIGALTFESEQTMIMFILRWA